MVFTVMEDAGQTALENRIKLPQKEYVKTKSTPEDNKSSWSLNRQGFILSI